MYRRTALAASAVLLSVPARAQPLSPAQIALFETPHLTTLSAATQLDYEFRREEEGKETLMDRIQLDARPAADAGRFDVTVEFLTGSRNLPYPPARGFGGNPLLLFALDRDARELAAATGGGMHWFRERIRRAFAEAAELRTTSIELDGRRIAATEITIHPFAGEPRARRFGERRYVFILSNDVPGAIHTIRSVTPAGEGGGALTENIVFRTATPLPAENSR